MSSKVAQSTVKSAFSTLTRFGMTVENAETAILSQYDGYIVELDSDETIILSSDTISTVLSSESERVAETVTQAIAEAMGDKLEEYKTLKAQLDDLYKEALTYVPGEHKEDVSISQSDLTASPKRSRSGGGSKVEREYTEETTYTRTTKSGNGKYDGYTATVLELTNDSPSKVRVNRPDGTEVGTYDSLNKATESVLIDVNGSDFDTKNNRQNGPDFWGVPKSE